jgi:hypothetical protein
MVPRGSAAYRRVAVMRWRDTRGQTGAELMGLLLVASLVVAAVAASGPGEAIAREIDRLVCQIAGGGDCGAPPATTPGGPLGGDADEGGEPPQGLPLEGQEVPVLPFPGSVTVSCTFADPQPGACQAPEGSVSVQVDASATVRRSATTFDPEGCPLTRLSVSTKLELKAGGTAEGARAGGSLEGHLGESTTFQVTVSPDAADDIADGDRPSPNPVDPTTIGPGESVLLSRDYYAGVGLSGSYRAIQASLGYDRGRRVSSGVQRINPSTVRVVVGDEDFVRHTLSLGLGVEGASASLGSTEQLSEGRLHAIDIDISTSAGWAAYQAFLESGTLPEEGTPGTTNPTRSEVLNYSDEANAEAELGPISVGGQLGSSEGRRIETTDADGNVETVVTARYNSVGLIVRATRDADGDPVGDPEYALTLRGADATMLEELQDLDGGGGDLPEDGTVRIDFAEDDLADLRELALEDIADQVSYDDDRISAEDVAEQLADGRGIVEVDGAQIAVDPWLGGIAAAQAPEEILVALYKVGDASTPGDLLLRLNDLLRNQDARLPGEIATPDCDG